MTAADEDAPAETRVLRSIVVVYGIIALVFFVVSYASIVEEASFLRSWWTPVAVTFVFGVPAGLTISCRWLSRRALRWLLGGYALGFTVVVASFVPMMVHNPMPVALSPWVLGITGLGTVPAALAWRPAFAWLYFFPNILLMGPVRDFSDAHENPTIALQDVFFSLSFTAIFTALAMMSMRSARAVDRAAASAREVAARASSAEARLRERARLDALVHDEVMATLYYATVGTPELDAAVARQARKALDELRAVGNDEDVPLEVDDFVNRLRSATVEQSPVVTFAVDGSRTQQVPADVASAFVEAAGEAVRNSLAYASTDEHPVPVTVLLSLDEGSVVASIADEGTGFNPRAVPPHRLGIRVSIEGRMATVPGCFATVESRPRHGTLVTLGWRK